MDLIILCILVYHCLICAGHACSPICLFGGPLWQGSQNHLDDVVRQNQAVRHCKASDSCLALSTLSYSWQGIGLLQPGPCHCEPWFMMWLFAIHQLLVSAFKQFATFLVQQYEVSRLYVRLRCKLALSGTVALHKASCLR